MHKRQFSSESSLVRNLLALVVVGGIGSGCKKEEDRAGAIYDEATQQYNPDEFCDVWLSDIGTAAQIYVQDDCSTLDLSLGYHDIETGVGQLVTTGASKFEARFDLSKLSEWYGGYFSEGEAGAGYQLQDANEEPLGEIDCTDVAVQLMAHSDYAIGPGLWGQEFGSGYGTGFAVSLEMVTEEDFDDAVHSITFNCDR